MEKLTNQEKQTELLAETAMMDALDVVEKYDPDYFLRSPAEKLAILATAQEDEAFEDKNKLKALLYFRDLAEKEHSFEALSRRFSEVLS